MSTAAGIVQGSNLVASHLGRVPEWRLKDGEIVNCRSAFLGKSTFLTSGFRLSAEMKGKRKSSSSSSASFVVLASGDAAEVQVETPEEVLSGEWPGNFSMLNYEDLSSYLEPMIFKEEVLLPNTLLFRHSHMGLASRFLTERCTHFPSIQYRC